MGDDRAEITELAFFAKEHRPFRGCGDNCAQTGFLKSLFSFDERLACKFNGGINLHFFDGVERDSFLRPERLPVKRPATLHGTEKQIKSGKSHDPHKPPRVIDVFDRQLHWAEGGKQGND